MEYIEFIVAKMTELKTLFLFLLFLAIPVGAVAQTEPYAELLTTEINYCGELEVSIDLEIKFYGESPFAIDIQIPTKNSFFEDYIFGEQLSSENVWNITYTFDFPVSEGAKNNTGTIELLEVYDNNTGWGPNVDGVVLTGEKTTFTNWAMPEINAGSDIDSCGLAATLNATPDPLSDLYYWEQQAEGNISDVENVNAIFEAPSKNNYPLVFIQENGACIASDTVNVHLRGSPSATIATTDTVCGVSSQDITLDLTFNGDDGPWEYAITDENEDLISNMSSSMTTSHTTSVTGQTTFSYEWLRDTNGCLALPGDIAGEATVMDMQPSTNAGEDALACGMQFQLEAIPDKGAGLWTTESTELSIAEPENPQSMITASRAGTYSLTWTENNDGCENSDETEIQFIEFASLSFTHTEDVICEGDDSSFAFEVSGENGPWSLNYSHNSENNTYDFANAASSLLLSPEVTTNYTILSLTDRFGCTTELNELLEVNVDLMPTPNAGNDTAICGNTINLNATISDVAQNAQWQAVSGYFPNEDSHTPKAVFESDDPGEYLLTWEEINGLCTASDQVIVRFDEAPTANAGDDLTLFHQYQTNLHARTPVSNQTDWIGNWHIISGSGSVTPSSSKDATISGLHHGKSILEWSVVNGVCPLEADTIEITVNDLTYYTGISPNGNGLNDYFKIEGAHTISANELIIFDQTGQVVHRNKNLDESNEWKGTDMDGSPLENGIYYFIFRGEGIEEIKDYIVIKRN